MVYLLMCSLKAVSQQGVEWNLPLFFRLPTLRAPHSTTPSRRVVAAYVALAKFSDAEFKQMDEYTRSKEFEDKRGLTAQLKDEGNKM